MTSSPRQSILFTSLLVVLAFLLADPLWSDDSPNHGVVVVGGRDLQAVLDRCEPYSLVQCNRNVQVTLSSPITVRKPLTLSGLNARLPEGLGQTSLVLVESEGVTVRDFALSGNANTVEQVNRAPLLVVSAGDFRVLNGVFRDSSKDGVMIDCAGPNGEERDVVGGVVRDVTGYNIIRDVVSISGGHDGSRIRNILVENVRCYGSKLRGPVEVSDGTDNITVRKVYAEDCAYAVDVQDHGRPRQVNSNVVIQDVYARSCSVAIRTANRPFGHHDLTIRDVTAESCKVALWVRNTNRLMVSNVRILGHGPGVPLTITDCDGVSLTEVAFFDAHPDDVAVRIQDCNDVRVHGVTYRGDTDLLSGVVHYRVASDEAFAGLQISGVSGLGVKTGILLDNKSQRGRLSDYQVVGNLASVSDRIRGARGQVVSNAPQGLGKQGSR